MESFQLRNSDLIWIHVFIKNILFEYLQSENHFI